jgi:IMP dehydrogenase
MKHYKQALCFDDILMVPQQSNIESRNDINISAWIGENRRAIVLPFPVIAAPMDTVCEKYMALSMRFNGGLGIIHRYMSIENQTAMVSFCNIENEVVVGAAVGATGDYLERAFALVLAGASLILVDTANGHNQNAVNAVKKLRTHVGNQIHIMAGNVSTEYAFMALSDAGADSVRVGIGGGAACTTRIVTGHGIPTLQSIIDIRNAVGDKYKTSIIADGGIKTSGDAVKAFAAGADCVMVGSAFAGTDESPGSIIPENGKLYKAFRGMASFEAQLNRENNQPISVIEGIATKVPYKGSVSTVIKDWAGGIRSGLSYSGVTNLKELYEESMYVTVSQASLGESVPHALKK